MAIYTADSTETVALLANKSALLTSKVPAIPGSLYLTDKTAHHWSFSNPTLSFVLCLQPWCFNTRHEPVKKLHANDTLKKKKKI